MNILLTGGSRGLGLVVAQRLLAHGDHVLIVNREPTDELAVLQQQYPSQTTFIACDLSHTDSIKKSVFDDAIGHETPLHGFINNAATAYDDLITNLNMEATEQLFRTNVFAPMLLIKYVIRNMLLHNISGSLVHVSSISAHTGYKGLAMYASTKGSIEAFSRTTAREWGSKGIRSNCVVAGFMETTMSATLSKEQRDRIYQRTALKQPTSLESVADSILFLLSAGSRSITGQNIFVDSGTI
ncbi:SDR family NAD(P)-dependent oxidoreductase [Aureliella helgolandensis]|uniref:3-oxoacyl-[acyl-carrier-protein] reductase FabG n=1 Tax=Aureliella helgolandensis TaxID=2527968 RepID=A0A518GC16_9BACT|nr:SDR family oxidoreductase [Aureliella helgolandensis]QDV26139.1 3-oxoacyl-[acyl-carrier-protein] reductase FabG [Aureliella helgolandensis]